MDYFTGFKLFRVYFLVPTNEINEFITTFFKLIPIATASELSYYVNDGILKPIGKEYIFQELVKSYSQSQG